MISKFINDLKKDKKKMLLVIAVIIVLVILIMPKNKNTQTAGFGTELSNILNNDYYSGTGTLTMCNYNFSGICISLVIKEKKSEKYYREFRAKSS